MAAESSGERSPAALHAPRGQAWDEGTIRRALERFLQGWKVWPTYAQFTAHGAKGLRDAVARIHGASWWAREMGLPGGGRERGGVRRWTDETIRVTLQEFFGERSSWPSNREFDEAGLHGLREALRHYGGPERWSRELGVSWRRTASRRRAAKPAYQRQSQAPTREWPRWTQRTITAELSEFLAGRTDWPLYPEFIQSGRKGLYQAVLRHGGAEDWAQRMGVKRVRHHGGGGPYWTERRVRERLGEFLRGRSVWPTAAEFDSAGQSALRAAVRRYGGAQRWAAEFGVGRMRRESARVGASSQPYWTDERIETAIAPLVAQLGRWPTKGEFRGAGLSRALAAVYVHGGSARWQERLGVSPRAHGGPIPDRRHWSLERVELELREFCAGRTTWPTIAEFEGAGRGGLYRAAGKYGGVAHWRDQLALPLSP